MGAGKAARYGDEFLKLIGDYVVENEILRPEDIRVKLVGKTNNIRIAIIQSIDRKLSLDVIADSKRLELDELITELEHIVANGTKIDITYHLREELDDDQIEDMMDYFRESEEDDIEEAFRELGSDYTDDQIRLARIKFISEMGN